jgi:hypothetical protein
LVMEPLNLSCPLSTADWRSTSPLATFVHDS